MKKKKKNNLLKNVLMIAIIIIVIELSIMLVVKILRERKIDHIDALNDLIMVDDYYIGVGASDFSDSKFVDKKIYTYTDSTSKNKEKQNIIATQSKIVKYDKDLNILWENTYDNLYDSTFYSVLKVSDGFIAVGSYVSKYSQIEINVRDGLIVKFDLNGKYLWSKSYHVLSDTEFYKIIDDGDDNFVVIGQSIYENMEMGNHITGGGIIVRYNKDGDVLAYNNYGGNKSGSFNDIIKVDDGYLVCGKDATNYGILVKFKKDFGRDDTDTNIISKKVLWQKTYDNTDDVGFTSMAMADKKIYLAGAIDVSTEKDKDGKPIFKYDAGIVIYSDSGKYLGSYPLNEEIHHRFTSIIYYENTLYLTGLLNVDGYYKGEKQDSLIISFDIKEHKYQNKDIYAEPEDYILEKITRLNKRFIIIGTSKNNCGIFGCEYKPIFTFYQIKA